jgi:hypothetical protein
VQPPGHEDDEQHDEDSLGDVGDEGHEQRGGDRADAHDGAQAAR